MTPIKKIVVIPKKKSSKPSRYLKFIKSNALTITILFVAIFMLSIMDASSLSMSKSFFLKSMIRYFENILADLMILDKTAPDICDITRVPVKKLEWKVGGRFIREIFRIEEPVIITDGPSRNWPVASFDLLEIARSGVNLTGVLWQKNPIFRVGYERDKGGMLGSRHDHAMLVRNISLAEFLKSSLNPDEYSCWTGDLKLWEDMFAENITGLSAASGNWQAYTAYSKGLEEPKDEDEEAQYHPKLQITHPGVVQQTKYDPRHEMLVQLKGSQRVLLFPPSPASFDYPYIHRNHRYSQVPLEASANCPETREVFPLSLDTPWVEATLISGETLYIPAFWRFRVESLALSLSLIVPSPSLLDHKLSLAYWHPVPFGPFQSSKELRALAVVSFLELLLRHVLSPADMENSRLEIFAGNLYKSRFQVLYPDDIQYSCPDLANATAIELVDAQLVNFKEAAENMRQILSDLGEGIGVKSVLLGFLFDYAEEVVRWAAGPKHTPHFIRYCMISRHL